MNEAQILGSCIAAAIGGWVTFDATKRGKKGGAAFLWGLGVFLALIIFLPVYLYLRKKEGPVVSAASQTMQCRYCGQSSPGDPAYCPHCDRQLKGAEEIHSSLR